MRKSGITIYEYDALAAASANFNGGEGVHAIPAAIFDWLEAQCLRISDDGEKAWLRLAQYKGRRVVKVASYVGVIRAPNGFQIEVLPKVGKAIGGGEIEARKLLIEMLRCLPGFTHIQTEKAMLAAEHMPLLEVFISEFLGSVSHIVKRGLRSDYVNRQDNLHALRGKLLIAHHMKQNLYRADRFFTEHDEFSTDRPENRLLHTALRRVLLLSTSQSNQKLASELCFIFTDIPVTRHVNHDFQRVRLDRGMGHYSDALAWARLILDEESPLTGTGNHDAPSLLFPMEVVFEAFVAKYLAKQIERSVTLKTQARSHHLVRHQGKNWFLLKPDLLLRQFNQNRAVLDTKWKLLNSKNANGTDKYGLSQSDFYQLYAYGQNYLDGEGDVILIYPKTDNFESPLDVFDFPKTRGIRLWVLPYCLKSRQIILPSDASINSLFYVNTVS